MTPVVVVRASASSNSVPGPPSSKSRCPSPRTSGWIKRISSSTSCLARSFRTTSPLPRITMSLASFFRSAATAFASSPSRSVELGHGSGSFSVRDTTYFGMLLSMSLNGPPALFQCGRRSSYVRRPSSNAPVVCMPSAASLPVSSSAYGTLQPPCLNPPRRSSSGRPGACMTPSRVTLLKTMIFVMGDPLGLHAAVAQSDDATCEC